MDAAENIAAELSEPLTWAEICEQCPDEWVFLIEIERETNGRIASARVVSHHRSINEGLKQLASKSSYPGVAYCHTANRLLRFPRIVMTDEIRELLRTGR